MTWGNLQTRAQEYEDVCATVAGWSAGTARPFAGMPRTTEPGYQERMRRAYNDTMRDLATVAKAPQTPTANVILGRMSVHATGFASCLRIDEEEFNPHAGPKLYWPHYPRLWPAATAKSVTARRESAACGN